MFNKFSVFAVVILCISTISADVSHVVGHGGAGTAVNQHTIDILKQNISNYLVHLEGDGSSQPMQLKHIYGATKQSVTSTIYTVQALLETSEGSKRCEIRVLEQPLFDFCQMRVTCENGGTYEVTMNQHGTHSHPFGLPDYVQPTYQEYQQNQHKQQHSQHQPQQQQKHHQPQQHHQQQQKHSKINWKICFC